MRRPDPEPVTRIGICCGCGADGVMLYKVPCIFRYRCAECYLRETGFWHWLAPPRNVPKIIIPE